MKNIFLVVAYASMVSCQKPDLNVSDPKNDTVSNAKIEVVWQVPLSSDTLEHQGEAQYLWNGNLIYGVNWNVASTLKMCDAKTGKPIWAFDGFEREIGSFGKTGKVFLFEDKSIIHDWNIDYCINNANGKIEWITKLDNQGGALPHAVKLGDFIYKIHFTGSTPKATSMSLVRTDCYSFKTDTLWSVSKNGDYYPFIEDECFELGVNAKGDTLLFFNMYYFWGSPQQPPNNALSVKKILAFNLNTRKIVWEKEDLDQKGNLGCTVVSGDKIFVVNYETIYCLNINTGETIWSNMPSKSNSFFLKPIIYKNLIICHSENIGTYGLDKFTGNLIWVNKDTDGNARKLTFSNGVIYFTSSGYARLYAIDALTGKTIWSEGSPNSGKVKSYDASFFESPIVIDSVQGVLYTADGYYLMCIKLPR
jgi:outer membrane protein assembly factor BamB